MASRSKMIAFGSTRRGGGLEDMPDPFPPLLLAMHTPPRLLLAADAGAGGGWKAEAACWCWCSWCCCAAANERGRRSS